MVEFVTLSWELEIRVASEITVGSLGISLGSEFCAPSHQSEYFHFEAYINKNSWNDKEMYHLM